MRGFPPSTRDLRRERLVGNWGGASEHIGSRWEILGLEMLQARVDSGAPWPSEGHAPRTIVSLGGDSLQTALSRSGLSNPDVIMVLQTESGETVLQALDFKWNIEFASYGQIRAEAIHALIRKGVPQLRSRLEAALDDKIDELPVLDGLLYAPDLPVNHWFLGSNENARQEYPIESEEVVFEEVDPVHFFGLLPGWEMAGILARLDRSEAKLRTLEGAEHFYRIGTGLLGAVSQLLVSVFVRRPPEVAASTAFDWLRARVRPPGSIPFVQHAERLMSTRSQLQARLRGVTRSPYRFASLVESLKAHGITLPEKEDGLLPAERERWGELLRKVAIEHRELIYRTGLRLVETGLTDAEALSRLESETRRYSDRARANADKLIVAALS